ncbi:chromosome-associated kinesin KIF4 isoform X2 [Ceratina calcarata]|uniref:Chromosome-associated kinesin KIF4 isoform X2 n=1 Tax=Ceratina calcarata TaxID=156304 RepID=A0AAJ7RYA0_9HYME|nr:chromosome-associated kinesin KIF4 isoform X2 [Ceratina calcarata]
MADDGLLGGGIMGCLYILCKVRDCTIWYNFKPFEFKLQLTATTAKASQRSYQREFKMSEDTVKVAVRIRPLVKTEIERGCRPCLDVVPGEQQIVVRNADKSFTFNYVFPSDIGQEDFYNTAVKSMVQNIFKGYNVTILAYGQTGSGKTHSMGTNYVQGDDSGIIPRAVNDIFETIAQKPDWSFQTTVSFMELYQEQLYDLLADKHRGQCIVDIKDDGKQVKVIGVCEKKVTNPSEALHCLMQGSLGRATGATAMNAQSSRSHAIFTLCIYQQKKDDPSTATTAKFHLVDLAGSERSKKTQATGERFKEGVNINKGLLALGNVISQLGDNGGSTSYVGYRDSKLTRLLQDSLGGNSVTLMIACISPADYNLDETLSTLRYADRARKIKNKPVVNQNPQVAEINRLNKLIQELQLALVEQEIRISCPAEHQELEQKNQMLRNKIRDLTEKLSSNLIEAVIMHERAELAEQAREKIQADVMIIANECKQLLDEVDKDFKEHDFRMHLETLYSKILDIQKDQKKTSEELTRYETSSFQANVFTNKTEELENLCLDEANSSDSLLDIDEKQEEHTLLQVKRNNEVQNINKELAIKESLIAELLKSSQPMIDHSKDIQEMEQEIRSLQTERDELMQALQSIQANNVSSKIAEARRKKVQELEKKMSELRRKIVEQDKIVKIKEKQDQQVKNLTREMQMLKQTRVKLIKQMRVESDKFAKWKQAKEKELNKWKDQHRKQVNENTRLKMWHSKQETVLKRKMEAAFAVNKRLKEALDLQKRAEKWRREKVNNKSDKIHSWINQELQILVSTVDAEYSLDKLMQDRAMLVDMLNKIQNSSDADEDEINKCTEFLELRNSQISDLQQKIIESDQENRERTRWQNIQTLEEARAALKVLFKHTAEDRRNQCIKENQYTELVDKYELLKAQFDEYRAKEKEKRMSRQLNRTVCISENEDEIIKLKEELEYFKQKCQSQEQTIFLKPNKKTKENKENVNPEVLREEIEIENFDKDDTIDDESIIEDDPEKDPDWRGTPLYNRISRLLSSTKNTTHDRMSVKRTSGGDVKCSCKTKCVTRVCSCRKNDAYCSGKCNCNSDQCQNKLAKHLFDECEMKKVEDEEISETSSKKLKQSDNQILLINN